MHLLGIDIGGTKVAVCLGDERGNLTASRRMPARAAEGPESLVLRTVELVNDILQESGLQLSDIPHVGISAPGPLSVRRGLLLSPPNMPGWVDVPLPAMFAGKLNRPVHMNNDANAAVLAESFFGAHKDVKDIVYITMSTGVGAGIISGGTLVQGAEDLGGEVGHHVLDANGPPCPCGQRGCFELFCGGKNVADRLRKEIVSQNVKTTILDHAGNDPSKIDFRTFTLAAQEGDPYALEKWDEYLERLAQGLGTILMMFNPSALILGTIAIHTGDFLLSPLRERIGKYAWSHNVECCAIEASSLGPQIGELSALAVAISAS
ncbi:MAG: ROK family protein [Verrucomicrobia bacterium]|nr:ROK family protein [Verrucomicrobiota bacterium]